MKLLVEMLLLSDLAFGRSRHSDIAASHLFIPLTHKVSISYPEVGANLLIDRRGRSAEVIPSFLPA